MNLRPYQLACIEAVEAGWKEAKRQLVVQPTGSGKTIVFSKLAERRQPARSLILAHREELIEQAAEKLAAATGIRAEIEKAERWASKSAPVVVASVQSLVGPRLERWPRDHFSLVICDEAHHSISKSWQSVLSYFGNADVLGVTATPDRGDQRELGEYFERVAFEVGLVDLIRDGYLAPIAIQSVPIKIDLSNVRQSAGDFDTSDVGHVLEPYLDEIARAIKTYASDRRVLAFLPLIETSKKFTAACERAGLKAEHVDGYDPDRQTKLQRFSEWEYDVLSNAMLLTEGFDDPGIDCVVCLRPTRSRALYSQIVGRGTRLAPLKENLLLLDFLWMHERHSVTRPAHLVARTDAEAEAIVQAVQQRANAGGTDSLPADLLEVSCSATEQREASLRRELEKQSRRKRTYISAEEFALNHGSLAAAEFEPVLAWEKKPVTDKQRWHLKRAGIDPETVRGREHARRLLDIHFANQRIELCTPKQRALLARLGHESPHTATKSEFARFMGQLTRRK